MYGLLRFPSPRARHTHEEPLAGYYLQSSRGLMTEIAAAAAALDGERLSRAVQMLKPSSANLGAESCATKCAELEARAVA